ncbi:MAG: hypothetical protein M1826_003417 [Phylliscum demangeonii]|nr:MAG: hypothetical protein M1826_003417 [Phylliscum demangeonii]
MPVVKHHFATPPPDNITSTANQQSPPSRPSPAALMASPSPSQFYHLVRTRTRQFFIRSHQASSAASIRHHARARAQGQWRRHQSSAAASDGLPKPSAFSRFWNSPIGVKTVHFWAPVMKWALVVAGISDFYRPVENLSLTQNLALTATGAIWTRWCFIIRPKNILLATVNFFLACVGTVQVTRILTYRRQVGQSPLSASSSSSSSSSPSASAAVTPVPAIAAVVEVVERPPVVVPVLPAVVKQREERK